VSIQTEPRTGPVTASVYCEIQDFYARQMQLLDQGQTQEWAATFTEDGVFSANAQPAPVRTRAAIAVGAAKASADLAAKGVQRRHWLGMVSVRQQRDGVVSAQCYALVIMTPRGGQPTIGASTACNDILVRQGGDWKVRERTVTRDDLT
jgi:3-phenylpropionate/cinnamic acid dioxygenase small subunit